MKIKKKNKTKEFLPRYKIKPDALARAEAFNQYMIGEINKEKLSNGKRYKISLEDYNKSEAKEQYDIIKLKVETIKYLLDILIKERDDAFFNPDRRQELNIRIRRLEDQLDQLILL